MAMDAKDLRIESALGAHSDDGNTKYAQSGTTFQTNGNKQYHDIGSNSLAKVDVPTARPCAIIGPDRVLPPQSTNDAYIKKVPVEPWPCTDNIYQHPPEYPQKPTEYQHSRNISPRQTFQENMQRIMVPPSYASVKNGEDRCIKNPKLMPLESKFCDVPYSINPINNEPKIIKNSEGLVLNNNPNQPIVPHGWANSGVNVRPLRSYGAPDLYQYSEYSNCSAPRPISMIRPHRNVHEEMAQVYQDRYHEASVRFKPYPTTKDRPLQNPHSRYDYIHNYHNMFQPQTSYPPHKYELQKSIPTHTYSVYPPVPLKYLERRMPVPTMEKYPRSPSQQVNFNQPFCNQNIPPTYGALPGSCLQNRAYPYAPDPSSKNIIQNRLYFESNNARKYYTNSENMFINDINRAPPIKADLMYPSYPSISVPSLPPHMYRKENTMKGYDHAIHYRNIDYSANINPLGRVPLQFSPQTMSISPDSNTSNDTSQLLGNAQDDCGYASQSSTASIRSIESGFNRISSDIYRRNDMALPHVYKFGQKLEPNPKEKKGLDVRQFLQMWNEGDEEGNDNNKEPTKQRNSNNLGGRYESDNSQEQLYVLDLVNVPKEELGKYDHIQKISKLPENIKGYNSIELLNQYEKLVESPGMNHFSSMSLQSKPKDIHNSIRNSFPRHAMEVSNTSVRPLSPLDVEAKISQSVIHKEVGCNFEIRPCSPQMMSVELATPVHTVLGERLIEKVVNPVKTKSPIQQRIQDNSNQSSSRSSPKVQSCKMASNQYPSPHVNEPLKTNYCLQDLESNSGVCLASLPRLDNDIELNFPEINQQFINDNKISSIQDLPLLEPDSGNAHKSNNQVHNQPFITEHINSGSDSDKEVSKLSKYRKQKRSSIPNDSDDILNMSLHRTSSVIIKNPDNSKCPEDYVNNIPLSNDIAPNIENIVNPINIVVESGTATNCSDKKKSVSINEDNYKSLDSDTAIDFSLNKSTDTQRSSITSLDNLNNVLENDTEVDQNICLNSESVNDSTAKRSDNLPNQFAEMSASEDFCNLQPKSPLLDNITCSRVLDNNILLQSIDENSQILQTHDTVITHSKSMETDISLLNATSLTNEIVSCDNLPSLNNDNENVPSNISAYKNTMSEKITTLNNDMENQALNYCLTEHSDDVVATICEPKYNLMEDHQKNHHIVKDKDVEENICSEPEGNNTLTEGIAANDLQTDRNDDEVYDLTIPESNDGKIQSVLLESDVNEDTGNIILTNDIEMSNPKRQSEQNIDELNFKSDDNGDFSNKGNNENSTGQELVNVNNVECTRHVNSVDLIPISLNYYGSTNYLCSEINVIKKDDLSSEIKIENITSDLKNKAEMSLSVLNGDLNNGRMKGYAESYQIKYKFTFYKEMFSSRVQNLLIYNEGLTKKCGKENTEEISNSYCNSNHCIRSGDNTKDSVKPQFDEKSLDPELENDTISEIISRKNGDKTIYKMTSDNSTEFVEDEAITAESHHSDANKDFIDPAEVQQNNIMTHTVNINKHSENFAMRNYNTESLLEMLEQETKDVIQENNIERNNKLVDQENNTEIANKLVEQENNTEIANKPVDQENNTEISNKLNYNGTKKGAEQLTWYQLHNRRIRTLKRSLSESAMTEYATSAVDMKGNYDNNFVPSRKRAKIADSEILIEPQVLTDNLTSFIQNNRRNSISTSYNDENVSFCIFIDNDCVLTEEDESCQKICYTEITDECLTTICTEEDVLNPELTDDVSDDQLGEICDEENVDSELNPDICYEDNSFIRDRSEKNNCELDSENILYEEPVQCTHENDLILPNMEDNTIEETWVEDVAYMETVISDGIAEDIIIGAPSSPTDSETSGDVSGNVSFVFNNENEHTNKVKHIYGNQMCDDDAELVEKLYRTPQMNVNKTLIDRESQLSQEYNRFYDNESLEKILSESNTLDTYSLLQNDSEQNKSLILPNIVTSDDVFGNKENLQDLYPVQESKNEIYSSVDSPELVQLKDSAEKKSKEYDDCNVHSCESSCDNFVSYKKEEKLQYAISSSPEVSSTTSEEKGPAILLKIRSYKGSKISEVNQMSASFNNTNSQRPLITKAAQKYIPPLKETIRDLKVKIRLPKQSLFKLQQLKNSKEKPKIDTNCSKLYIKSLRQENPKKIKSKPKFEDVLMSIDEIQFKKHKIKNKKTKQSVPKVIIKKNENGAHYASTQTKETFNPDLTGRKWQPWVFLEKSNFVDKMALKQKFKAIYSHRKKTYVLAENFRKYKSISNAKFVISHPKSNDNSSSGKLKYTFRLKHT